MGRPAFHRTFVLVCAFLASLAALPIRAGVDGGTVNLEVYAGRYEPDDPYDADLTFGFRGGGTFTDHFGLQGSTGYFSSDLLDGDLDYRILFAELSAVWYVNPKSPLVLMVYGGSGLVFSDVASSHVDADELAASFHAGAGLNISLGRAIYLRPDARLRWIGSGVEYDHDAFVRSDGNALTDVEATVSLGFTFGS